MGPKETPAIMPEAAEQPNDDLSLLGGGTDADGESQPGSAASVLDFVFPQDDADKDAPKKAQSGKASESDEPKKAKRGGADEDERDPDKADKEKDAKDRRFEAMEKELNRLRTQISQRVAKLEKGGGKMRAGESDESDEDDGDDERDADAADADDEPDAGRRGAPNWAKEFQRVVDKDVGALPKVMARFAAEQEKRVKAVVSDFEGRINQLQGILETLVRSDPDRMVKAAIPNAVAQFQTQHPNRQIPREAHDVIAESVIAMAKRRGLDPDQGMVTQAIWNYLDAQDDDPDAGRSRKRRADAPDQPSRQPSQTENRRGQGPPNPFGSVIDRL